MSDRPPFDPAASWSVALDATGLRPESAPLKAAGPPGANLVPMMADGNPTLSPRRQGVPFTGVGGQTWGYGVPYGSPWAWGRLGGLLPGSKLDYAREAGDLWRNSVVAIALGWIADNFADARPVVNRRAAGPHGQDEPIPDHPLTRLLERPNPFYSARALWAAVVLSLKTDGNAYLIKARGFGGHGPPLQLWWTPPWTMFPQWPTGPTTTFIDHYKYVVDGRVYRLEPSDVVHFRDGLDPYNLRLGLGRLKGVLRSICSVNEADGYTAAILRNMGIPGIMFTPDGPENAYSVDEASMLALLEKYKQQVGGEDRGSAFGTSIPMKAERLGLSPQELALDTITELPIAQVCAALRIAPMVLGLPDPGRTYSNLQEAREAAWLDCLVPLQNLLVEDGLQSQLLPDLGNPERELCGWDRSKVLALQGDSQVKTQAAVSLFTADLLPQNRALEVAGLAPVEGGDERYYSKNGPPASIEEQQEAAQQAQDRQGQGDGEDGDEEATAAGGAESVKALTAPKASGKTRRTKGAAGGDKRHPEKQGHWVTTHDGRHLFIRGDGEAATGPHGKVVGKRGKPAEKSGKTAKKPAAEANTSRSKPRTKAVSKPPASAGKTIGKAEHEHASAFERRVTAAVGGRSVGRRNGKDLPMDVLVRGKDQGVRHGIEVKTIQKQSGPGHIKMHDDALLRKVRYATNRPGRVVHTVVADLRGETPQLYYKRGTGRYALSKMHPIAGEHELPGLIHAAEHDLPPAARDPGWIPQGAARAKLERSAEAAHASRLRKDMARKRRLREEARAAAGTGA